jgi:bifunctional non-homologous end joining protein LigD
LSPAGEDTAMMAKATEVDVEIDRRRLKLSNLDKVLWPGTGFTKGQMIDYYARIAPAMVPHLAGRPITLRRYPNGVTGQSFFEKNCPSHRPSWVPTVEMSKVGYCQLDEPAALAWVANLAAIELHPTLARGPDLGQPLSVVFDLDPGAPADVLTCARVAMIVRDTLETLGLQAWAKTSGSKGLQLYVPLNTPVTYRDTKPFAQALAQVLEQNHPDLIVSTQDRAVRTGKILIDWSQNTASKTTVAVYSVRARDRPTVSTPVTWDELDDALGHDDADALVFDTDAVLARVAKGGDLMAPVLEVAQELPAFSGG